VQSLLDSLVQDLETRGGLRETTLPLAMKVSTPFRPSAPNNVRSSSIVTTWPPTLIARRNATSRVLTDSTTGQVLGTP
jgi:hypothetical protein